MFVFAKPSYWTETFLSTTGTVVPIFLRPWFFLLKAWLLPSFLHVGKKSQLLLQPTQVELSLQVGVEFDKNLFELTGNLYNADSIFLRIIKRVTLQSSWIGMPNLVKMESSFHSNWNGMKSFNSVWNALIYIPVRMEWALHSSRIGVTIPFHQDWNHCFQLQLEPSESFT